MFGWDLKSKSIWRTISLMRPLLHLRVIECSRALRLRVAIDVPLQVLVVSLDQVWGEHEVFESWGLGGGLQLKALEYVWYGGPLGLDMLGLVWLMLHPIPAERLWPNVVGCRARPWPSGRPWLDIWVMPALIGQRLSWVGPKEHRLSVDDPIDPNGGNVWDGRRAPGLRNTFVLFFRFFHLALKPSQTGVISYSALKEWGNWKSVQIFTFGSETKPEIRKKDKKYH